MKLSYFVLADSVHVYKDVKVVIVGVFNIIKATDIPLTFRPFGIALELEASRSEAGKEHDGLVILRKSGSRKAVIQMEWNFRFPEYEGDIPASTVLGMNLPPLKLDSAGKYVFEFKVAGKRIAQTNLYVVEAKAKAKKKARKAKRSGKAIERKE